MPFREPRPTIGALRRVEPTVAGAHLRAFEDGREHLHELSLAHCLELSGPFSDGRVGRRSDRGRHPDEMDDPCKENDAGSHKSFSKVEIPWACRPPPPEASVRSCVRTSAANLGGTVRRSRSENRPSRRRGRARPLLVPCFAYRTRVNELESGAWRMKNFRGAT